MESVRAATTRHPHADQSVHEDTYQPTYMYLPHLPDGEGGKGAKGTTQVCFEA